MLEQQLTAIREVQSARALEHDSGDVEGQLAYVLELSDSAGPEALQDWFSETFPEIDTEIEPVFTSDDAPRHFVIHITRTRFKDIPGSAFEIAYAMQASGFVSKDANILHAEPAVEAGFTGLGPIADPGDEFEAAVVSSGCFTPEHDKPTMDKPDRYSFDWAPVKLKIPEVRKEYGVTGKGIKIAHIDTGIAVHDEIAGIDPADGINLFNENTGALDPLTDPSGFLNPGHGTATSSLFMSDSAGHVDGVSPGACIYPIRAIRTVIRLTQWRVARAIDRARECGAHVISMSLGGIWSWVLWEAIRRAEKENILILAAAGNCVKIVVYPARYKRCLAVAGTTYDDTRWRGSCRGKTVDVCAPAQYVWCASRKRNDTSRDVVGAGEGTSFAVALTAGVAALWLERNGRDKLINSLSREDKLMDLFRREIRRTSRQPTPPLGDEMGKGIVNAHALLSADPFSTSPSLQSEPDRDEDAPFEHLMDMLVERGFVSEDDLQTAKAGTYSRLEAVAQELQYVLLATSWNEMGPGGIEQPALSMALREALDDIPALESLMSD
jgi:hypothetical protein